MENSHINESILSEEILEDQKKNRIDHMTYLPDMEDIGSDVMDQVVSAMNAYDYDKYTSVHRKILLLFFLPLLFRFWRKLHRLPRKRRVSILATAFICSHRSTLPTTVRTTAFTVVSTATTRSTVRS